VGQIGEIVCGREGLPVERHIVREDSSVYNRGVAGEGLTHDDVRKHLRELVQTLGPKLADAVLSRRDYEYMQELATRLDAAAKLVKRFDEYSGAHPDTSAFLLLKDIAEKLASEKEPEAPRGPSIWELLQKPAL
jgi:hypothetical protein